MQPDALLFTGAGIWRRNDPCCFSQIRRIHYVWAMVRHFSEDLAEPPAWKLHEMGIEYQAPLLA